MEFPDASSKIIFKARIFRSWTSFKLSPLGSLNVKSSHCFLAIDEKSSTHLSESLRSLKSLMILICRC